MRRNAVIAGSVIASLVTGAVLATTGGAQEQGGQTIKLVTKNARFNLVDHRPRTRGENFGIGDQFSISTPAFRGGKRVGSLDAACFVTLGGKKGRGVCDGVYNLKDGDIYIAVRLRSSDAIGGAVVGGTGAYVGARGSFKSVDRKGNKGGDPSDDTITLLP